MPPLGFRDPMVVCGSLRGYERHRYHGEPPCGLCTRAKEATYTVSEVRAGRVTRLHIPYPLLGELLRTASPEAIAWAEDVLRPGAVEASRIALELAQADEDEVA